MTEKKKGGRPKKVAQMGRPTFYEKSMIRTSLILPEELIAGIDQKRGAVSRSEYIRQLVIKDLEQ